MNKNILIYLLILISSINTLFATSNLLECGFGDNDCGGIGVPLFYANPSSYTGLSFVINSPISSEFISGKYTKPMCCKINNVNLGDLSRSIENFDKTDADMNCNNQGEDLMYFTNSSNARVGFPISDDFNKSYFNKKLCVKLPDELSRIDFVVSDDNNYANIGYTCIYKTNFLETNGIVSSCDAIFNGYYQYKYTVWGKLQESIESLKCNSDCTSKLDNRVYSACGTKISSCSQIPSQCDGSLLSGWVKYNSTHQVKCSNPWNIYRSNPITSTNVEVKTLSEKCSSLINKKYSVILDNELITMSVYICKN